MTASPIYIDADGVLVDFVTPFLEAANRVTGRDRTIHDLPGWDILPMYPEDKHDEILSNIIQPGWCRSLKPLPGAREAVDELRKLSKVYCATSPWTSGTWHSERTEWLMEHMGFNRHEVIHIHDKWCLRGLTLIDDKVDTLVKWTENTGRIGILWTQPYNQQFDCFGAGIWRASDWGTVVDYVQALQRDD